MDFINLGKHCTVCKQQDFLPFSCKYCNKWYCLRHRMSSEHDCTNDESKRASIGEIMCPLCNTQITYDSKNLTYSLDSIVNDHISNTCSRNPELFCSYCKGKDLMPYTCKKCNKVFCTKHRFPEDHHCNTSTVSITTNNTNINKKSLSEKKEELSRLKVKMASKGLPNIPEQFRFALNISVPDTLGSHNSNNKLRKNQYNVFIDKRKTLLENFPYILSLMGIDPSNTSTRYSLVNSSKVELPNFIPISILESQDFKNGDSLFLKEILD